MKVITFLFASGNPGVAIPGSLAFPEETEEQELGRLLLTIPSDATDVQTIDYADYVAPPPSPAQVLAQKLSAGITLTSTGTPAINGTYAYDSQTQTDLSGIAATIGLLGTFPDGTTDGYQYPQLGGQAVTTFPSIDAFKALYGPYAKLLQQLRAQGAILAGGGPPDWPSQQVTTA